MTATCDAAGPFAGLLVVAVEQAVAAPLCTSRLAAAGARVIKIERHGGDFARNYDAAALGEASYFVWLNQDKESLELDLKAPDDLALLRRIVSRADVFIQNLAPGATERLGLGSADLRAAYPRLVTCDISGYGDSGDYRNMKAYDFLVQCETGLVGISGAPEPAGMKHPSVAPYGGFASRDGQVIAISIQNEREWANLCHDVLGDPDMAKDIRFVSNNLRVQHREALDAALASFFAERSASEIRDALLKARIAFGSVNSVADLWGHPQLRTRAVGLPDGQSLEVIDWAVQPAEPAAPRAARVVAAGHNNVPLRREFSD